MLIRSRANNHIMAMRLPIFVNGWDAVKLTMSDNPFPGEAPIGALFSYSEECWEKVDANDARELARGIAAIQHWVFLGKPLIDLFMTRH